MKYICIISAILLLMSSSCSNSRMEMSNEIKELSAKVDSLTLKVDELSEQNRMQEEEISWISTEMLEMAKIEKEKMAASALPSAKASGKSKATINSKAAVNKKSPEKAATDGQCLAITTAGKRCSRIAVKGSKYCWQHKETYEPEIPSK